MEVLQGRQQGAGQGSGQLASDGRDKMKGTREIFREKEMQAGAATSAVTREES